MNIGNPIREVIVTPKSTPVPTSLPAIPVLVPA